jgi:8-oxo-dGTP diphosphatase
MEKTSKHFVSVAAVISDSNGRALVIRRRDNGQWEPPGGTLEIGETIYAGLRREVKEETGLEVEPESLAGVYKNMKAGVVALVFRCTVLRGTPHETQESSDVTWMTRDEIRERVVEAFAIRLLDGLDHGTVAVRTHDGVNIMHGD